MDTISITKIIESMLSSGPGWTLVGAILIIGRSTWLWLWDEDINAQTGKMKGPLRNVVLQYELTQEEMRNSIKATAVGVATSLITDAKKDVCLSNIEASIKNIEEQLTKINKGEQSVSTQRVLRMLINTLLELAQQAGIDVTTHRAKFIAYLQDSVNDVSQTK